MIRDDEGLVRACRAVMARHARTFNMASRLLPADVPDRTAVLYALCREIDDSVDEAPSQASAEAAVGAWRRELRAAASGDPDHAARPVVRASVRILGSAPTVMAAAEQLVEGMAGDLGPVRIADEAALIRYGYRVAGSVGLMMCAVLGVTDRRAWPHAIDLGIAMQLTNICRDVLEDAARDRVYLPATWLGEQGVATAELLDSTVDRARLAGVVRRALRLADTYYASAHAGMRFIPAIPRQAILVASAVYRAIGLRLARQGADPMRGRVVVPPGHKAIAAVRGLGGNLRLPRRDEVAHDRTLHRPLAGLPGVRS